ncbi:MAG TPA: hypothetical protein VG963_09695, partial [Polyangiaceae bacterium]|nr:hypothetical protein [Polyangiaceae bacterium]
MPSLPPSGGAPRRLSVERGNWVLEILRNVNIGHDLVRPLTERVRGTRQITSYLKSNPEHERLARAAQKLMQAPPSNDVRSYSVAGDEWVCNSLPPPPPEPEERENEARLGLEQRLGEVSARLTALMALHEGLLARLARLEARVSALDLQEPSASSREGRGVVPQADAEVPLFASDEEFERGAGAFAEERASLAEAEPRAAFAPSARASGSVLALPSADELARCIAALVGNVTLERADELELNESTQGHYAARLEAEGGG